MNIRELVAITGIPERQMRYLIAEGFMPPPRGGRANADYGDDHVAAIRRYTRLRELGFPPAAIKLLREAKEGAPFPVAPGVTLVVDPQLLGSGGMPVPWPIGSQHCSPTLLKEPNMRMTAPANAGLIRWMPSSPAALLPGSKHPIPLVATRFDVDIGMGLRSFARAGIPERGSGEHRGNHHVSGSGARGVVRAGGPHRRAHAQAHAQRRSKARASMRRHRARQVRRPA